MQSVWDEGNTETASWPLCRQYDSQPTAPFAGVRDPS